MDKKGTNSAAMLARQAYENNCYAMPNSPPPHLENERFLKIGSLIKVDLAFQDPTVSMTLSYVRGSLHQCSSPNNKKSNKDDRPFLDLSAITAAKNTEALYIRICHYRPTCHVSTVFVECDKAEMREPTY